MLKEQTVLTEAINTYGKETQIVVAIEELSELIKELTKNIRGRDNVKSISEEMADVYIMLYQLKLIFDNDQDVGKWTDYKINRLDSRIRDNDNKRK